MDQADIKLVGAIEAHLEAKDARIAQLEKALREIAALDYKNAATNGAAYEAVQIASRVLMERGVK